MAQENEHKFYVTKEGLDELLKEQDNLIHVVRQQVIVELQEARAQGDLSENADYDAARDHQGARGGAYPGTGEHDRQCGHHRGGQRGRFL